MNLKLISGFISTTLTVGGATTAYFLIKSKQQTTKKVEIKTFKNRFPNLKILPITLSNANTDAITWKPKIQLLKGKFAGASGELYRKRLVESMSNNGISQDLIKIFIDIEAEKIQETNAEARILSLYCNKIFDSDYETVKDLKDVVKELCSASEQ